MGNIIGAGWMILAMAFYAMVDAGMKLSATVLPVSQILIVIPAIGFAAFSVALGVQGRPPITRATLRGAALLRSVSEAGASTLFVIALGLIPISLFTTIIQANPLLVVLGAALFLGERVGWRRWLAIGIGLFGVLVVLRPWGAGFEAAALFAVAGVVLQSTRDVATRRVPPGVHSLQLAAAGMLALLASGVVIGLWQGTLGVMPQGRAWLYLGIAGGLLIPATYAMVAAMRVGEVGFVAPFRYTRIVFGLAVGVVVFSERLDTATLVGAAIITLSGLYTFWREAVLRRRALQTEPAAL